MNIKLVGILFAVGSLVACGDSGTGGSGGGTGGSPSTGGGPSSGGGGSDDGGAPPEGGAGGGAVALTCDTGCELLFDCGLTGTPPLCVYMEADHDGFVPECIAGCMEQPALLALLDPEDCPGNIMTVSTVNPAFNDFCDNGPGQGGAGGAQ